MEPRPGASLGRALRAGFFISLLLWLAVGASVYAAQAAAEPYVPVAPGSTTEPALEGLGSCPAAPAEPYEGSDDAAGELRLLRSELSEACEALAKRTDEVSHRLWWVVAEALQARDQRVLTNTLSSEIRDRLDLPLDATIVALDAPDPFPVTEASSGEQAGDLTAAIDASGNAVKEALWFLIGLLAFGAGFGLYKVIRP